MVISIRILSIVAFKTIILYIYMYLIFSDTNQTMTFNTELNGCIGMQTKNRGCLNYNMVNNTGPNDCIDMNTKPCDRVNQTMVYNNESNRCIYVNTNPVFNPQSPPIVYVSLPSIFLIVLQISILSFIHICFQNIQHESVSFSLSLFQYSHLFT